MLRYGTALAFAAKACLVTSVLSAFREQLWATVRSRFLGLGTLDDIFAAPQTPFSLLNWEFLSNAKVVAILALYSWLSPLIVILTTNTLLVESALEIQTTVCPNVRSLNFSHEETSEVMIGTKIIDLYQLSLSMYNFSAPYSRPSPPHYFEYWLGTSRQAEQLFQAATYSKRPLSNFDDTFKTCEKGWNCITEIEFDGPAYKCQQISKGTGAKGHVLHQESGDVKVPFSYESLVPTGDYTYVAHATLGEYKAQQFFNITSGGYLLIDPPFPKHVGAFRIEPIVWVGYSEITNTSIPAYTNISGVKTLNACELYEATYTAELRYIDGVQLHRVINRQFLHPVVNTSLLQGVDANDGTMDNVTATPEKNYILPKDVGRYRRVSAYHSMGSFFRSMLNGTIVGEGTYADTKVEQTSLIDLKDYLARPNVSEEIQAYFDMLVLSLFTNPRFLPVVWAASPDTMTGTSDGTNYTYPCTKSRPGLKYYYRARALVLVYGVAVFLAVLGVAAGAVALRKNGGISRNIKFFSILAASRSTALNNIDWEGPEKDRGNVSSGVMLRKLGYGQIRMNQDGGEQGSAGEGHDEDRYGFGFEGEVGEVDQSRGTRK
ncbi:hypothetical protein CPLU01_09427 [Colletotrichum plurivorum]|uniref:Uncharacterized protein n=1 Tax=Colletotrichum plurivorum TaxID=2175906 RepID=A0A8H6K8U4_9PEZI|nr:hypothetical protein CPLU01_09427 [Colletotrichum plurivorum]